MTRDSIRQLIPVLQAFVDGKTIQCRANHYCEWEDLEIDRRYALDPDDEYRIKPDEAQACCEEWVRHSASTAHLDQRWKHCPWCGRKMPQAKEGTLYCADCDAFHAVGCHILERYHNANPMSEVQKAIAEDERKKREWHG